MDAVAAASQQFTAAPLVAVFDFGYSEVRRQVAKRGSITNPVALERTLQLGISEEITKLERNMSWLATAATVSPFIGLFGTVFGIIDAFQALGLSGSTSMRTVGAGHRRTRCSRPRWVCSPRFPPRSFTTISGIA